MRLVQYELPVSRRSHSYYYIGDSENFQLATKEQPLPINYFPTPTSQERDALLLLDKEGFQNLSESRPRTTVSFAI